MTSAVLVEFDVVSYDRVSADIKPKVKRTNLETVPLSHVPFLSTIHSHYLYVE